MKLYLIISCNIIFFFVFYTANSQVLDDAKRISQDTLSNGNSINGKLSHAGNSYFWDGSLYYLFTGENFNFKLSDTYHSTLIRTNTKYIQDVHNLNFDFSKKISEPLNFILKLQSVSFSDDRSIGINNASGNAILSGIETKIFDPFLFETLAGWKFDNQIGEKDNGFSYFIDSRLNNYNFYGYLTDLSSSFSADYLTPRKNSDNRILLSVKKEFSDISMNILRFDYRKYSKDFYISIDSSMAKVYQINSNIEKRDEESFYVYDDLSYNLFKNISLSFNTNIYSRTINKSLKYKNPDLFLINTFDLNINEMRLEGSFALSMDFEDIKNFTRFGISEREEKRSLDFIQGSNANLYQVKQKLEKSKDNTARLTYLSMNNLIRLSTVDEVQISGLAQILRYDTPGEGNNDDRDEQQFLIGLTYLRIFNESLNLKTTLDLNSSHNVFLFSERSANNAYNKIIRLNSAISYSPSVYFRSYNVFEVQANYTIYDFEEVVPSSRSMVFRQFLWLDSTSISLNSKASIHAFSYLKLFERGDLNWDEFKEQPIEYMHDNTIGLQLRYLLNSGFSISAGYKVFYQYRYNYLNGEKKIAFTQKSAGPVFQIFANYGGDFLFTASGWYETISNEVKILRKIANFDVNIKWFF